MTASGGHQAHFLLSSYRETLVEHRLLGDLLTIAWVRDEVLEVSRAETDQYGYDIVLTRGPVTRHVQVKSSVLGGRTQSQTVNIALEQKQSACVVWVVLQQTENWVGFAHLLFYGGMAGSPIPPLGEVKGRNPRSKTERPMTRVITKSRFTRLKSVEELSDALFAPSLSRAAPSAPTEGTH